MKLLNETIKEKLKSNGIDDLFPIQSTVVPFMIESWKKRVMGILPQDVCVSAATGSGKTLAYVIPILNVH